MTDHPVADDASAHEWACLEHGPIAEPSGAHCPTCGLALFDLRNKTDLETIEVASELRRENEMNVGGLLALPIGLLVLIGLAYLAGPEKTAWAFYPVLILFALAIGWGLRFRESKPIQDLQREADRLSAHGAERRRQLLRWLSSAPVLACAVLIVIFAVEQAGTGELLVGWVAIPASISAGKQLENLLLAGLLHANLGHLLLNCLGLLLFGRLVDLRVGRTACLLLMVSSSVAGMLFHSLLTVDATEGVIGFSGADFGLLGAMLGLMPTGRIVLNSPQGGGPVPLPNFIGVPILVVGYGFMDYLRNPHIALLAHIGGFVAGFLLSLALRALPEPPEFRDALARQEARIERLEGGP